MLTNDECLVFMREIEKSVPVSQWTIDGLHIWPLVRYEIHQENIAYLSSGRQQSTIEADRLDQRVRRKLERVGTMARGAARAVDASVRDRMTATQIRNSSALLYSDGVLFSKLEGRWYDRVCDPFVDALDAHGVSHLTITPLDNHFYPRRSPSLFVQPMIDAAAMWANLTWARRASSMRASIVTPGYEKAIEIARRARLPASRWTLERLAREVHFVQVYASIAEKLLRAVGARSAFIVCYYGAERAAMCLACRRLGIPSVDLQHGAAGESRYWAYADWFDVPQSGFELLPEYFWCWSERDVAEIERWTSKLAPGTHTPIAAGNLFLSNWRDGRLELAKRYDELISASAAAKGNVTHVLVTLNGYEDDAKLRRMAAVARDAAGSIHFWWRAHPSRWQQRSVLEQVVRDASLRNVTVGQACEAPLYSLLRVMHAHSTEVSSVSFEAEAFGVPTVFTHPGEAVAYEPIVRRGAAVVVGRFEDLPVGLEQLRRVRATRASIVEEQSAAERRGLDRMLRIARGERP
jgi:hypothetical protein